MAEAITPLAAKIGSQSKFFSRDQRLAEGKSADRRCDPGRRGNTETRLKDCVRIQGERFTGFIATAGKQIDGSSSATLRAADGRTDHYVSEATTAS